MPCKGAGEIQVGELQCMCEVVDYQRWEYVVVANEGDCW